MSKGAKKNEMNHRRRRDYDDDEDHDSDMDDNDLDGGETDDKVIRQANAAINKNKQSNRILQDLKNHVIDGSDKNEDDDEFDSGS